MSPSSKRHDMLRKLDLYTNAGVKEYWLADPDKKAIYVYTFDDEGIKDYRAYISNTVVKSDVLNGLELKLEEIYTD